MNIAYAHFKAAPANCERCGTEYLKRRPWARFCSTDCKNLHEKETAAANALDAARYRALRGDELYKVTGLYVADGGRDWRVVKGEELDTRIDASIGAKS